MKLKLAYIHNCKIIAFDVELFSLFVNIQMQIMLDRIIGKLYQTPHFYFSILIHYWWSLASLHLVLILSLIINNWNVGWSRWNENCPPQPAAASHASLPSGMSSCYCNLLICCSSYSTLIHNCYQVCGKNQYKELSVIWTISLLDSPKREWLKIYK